MVSILLKSIRLTLVLLALLAIGYTAVVFAIAQLAPGAGRGFQQTVEGRPQFTTVGQAFTSDRYFQTRPSAVDYNAAGSAGSNKGPSNPDYLATVSARIDTFLVHNPGVTRAQVPAELVTASGSGLDPHLSPDAARVQVARIARVRGLQADRVSALVDQHIEGPWLGMFGPSKVHVLRLNIALDALSTNN